MRIRSGLNYLLLSVLLAVCSRSAISGKLNIKVEFPDDSLTYSQRTTFTKAAQRWEHLIEGARPFSQPYDLVITATGKPIDGVGKILGRAGPTHVWSGTNIPVRGIMEFDQADLASMERNGSLLNVITHEMGHVLGLGSTWSSFVDKRNPNNVVFTGSNGMSVYTTWKKSPMRLKVPVESTGGPGTYGSHWSESVFGNELMTGYLNPGVNPLSKLTLAALDDLGYSVRYQNADPYRLPTHTELRSLFSEETAYGKKKVILPVPEENLTLVDSDVLSELRKCKFNYYRLGALMRQTRSGHIGERFFDTYFSDSAPTTQRKYQDLFDWFNEETTLEKEKFRDILKEKRKRLRSD